MPEWMTIQDAIRITKRTTKIELTDSDIYRRIIFQFMIYLKTPALSSSILYWKS